MSLPIRWTPATGSLPLPASASASAYSSPVLSHSSSAAGGFSFPSPTGSFSPTLLTLLEQLTPSLPAAASADTRLLLLLTCLKELLCTSILMPTALSAVSLPQSAEQPPAADARMLSELLLLCYVDALAWPLQHAGREAGTTLPLSASASLSSSSSSPSLPSPAPLSLPPSASSLSFLSFLASHPHFCSTSAFASLLSYLAESDGLHFLLLAADTPPRLQAALRFVACHGLSRFSSSCLKLLLSRGQASLLLQSSSGCSIVRCLQPAQQLELVLLLLLPAAASASSVPPLALLSLLSALLPALDVHSLYRLQCLLAPAGGAVSFAQLDSHCRILTLELWLQASIRLRAAAEQREQGSKHRRHGQDDEKLQWAEVKAQPADSAEGEDGVGDAAADELGSCSLEALQSALLQHRGSYRQWLIAAALADCGQWAALAALHEAGRRWTDAFDARLRALQRLMAAAPPPPPAARASAMLHLLRVHVLQSAGGAEQARLLALLLLQWDACGLRREELEAELESRLPQLADGLCILAFAPSHSLQEALTAPLPSPVLLSPRLLLLLTRHRLQLLRGQHAASLSSHPQAASTRLWQEVLACMQDEQQRQRQALLSLPSASLPHADGEELLCFTCGHSVPGFELHERLLPELSLRLLQLRPPLPLLLQSLQAEYLKDTLRVACPACVWTAVQAEAQRMRRHVERIVAAAADAPLGAHDKARGGAGGEAATAAGAGGDAAEAHQQQQQQPSYSRSLSSSPVSSPASSPTLSQSRAAASRDRTHQLETWR